MPMPPWEDPPANREYKRRLAGLRAPLPRWWPGRMNAEVVGGDLDTGAVVVHLPVEGNPYLARIPASGPSGGNTDVTMADLDRGHVRYTWTDGEWTYVVFSREYLSDEDLGHIRLSMRTISLEKSSRAVTFNPTDRELFDVQRQGFDWQLLQIGAVHRYRDTFGLDTACGHLADLGYLVHTLDAGGWVEKADMHTALAAALSFPSYYGRNLDAFDDLLSDVGEYRYGSDPTTRGTVLAIANFGSLVELDRRTATVLLEIFADHARLAALFGHAMLCLVDTTDEDLGRHVHAARVMELPPDPPKPFDESIVIEFNFQCYATPAEATGLKAHLGALVAPVLSAVGRFQTHTQLTSERAGQFDEVHSSSGRTRTSGQDLVDVTVATRGSGDRSTLGDQVFHAVSGHLDFEQMTERSYTGSELTEILARYPSLA